MDDETARLLRELGDTIERSQADGQIDDDERVELRRLVERVQAALAEPAGEHEGIVDHIESTAVRFEVDHPGLAGMLRSVVDTLSGYGI